MTQYRVLILDDRTREQDNSTHGLIQGLKIEHQQLLDFRTSANELWEENSVNDEVELKIDFGVYDYFFIHDSFNDPLVFERNKGKLIEKLSLDTNVILFSGTKRNSSEPVIEYSLKKEGLGMHYAIPRHQYIRNMPNFLDSFLILGRLDVRYLYDYQLTPANYLAHQLKEEVIRELEVSLERAASSNSLIRLIDLKSGKDPKVIIPYMLAMGEDGFVERLEELTDL